MYKCKLQELCQRRNWDLPVYSTVKIGPNHMPRYTASVNVKGDVFETPADCKSTKDAQNTAAQIAFDHFYVPPPPSAPVSLPGRILLLTPTVAKVTPASPIAAVNDFFPVSPLPSSIPIPSAGLFAMKNDAIAQPASMETLQQNNKDTSQASLAYGTPVGSNDNNNKDTLHVSKNWLQQFAQKQNLGFPEYSCEAKGPPHARFFKSSISLGGKSYETPEYFTTLKKAEQAAARLACQILSVDVIQEDGVEIGSDTFQGTEAKTKKLSEMNAAKVAYYALTEDSVKESSQVSSTNGRAFADNMTQNIPHIAMVKQHQDTPDEEAQDTAIAKTGSAPGKMIVNAANPAGPSHTHSDLDNNNTSMLPEHSPVGAADNNVAKQLVEGNPSTKLKTVVFPRKLNFQVPECAHVMPYSDDRWVAYKVPESTA